MTETSAEEVRLLKSRVRELETDLKLLLGAALPFSGTILKGQGEFVLNLQQTIRKVEEHLR